MRAKAACRAHVGRPFIRDDTLMSAFHRNDPNVGRSATPRQDMHGLDDDICVHILTSSSVMVGVCLTVVGVLRVVITLQSADVIGDDLLTINTMVYLAAALLAYCGLRTRNRRRNHKLEYAADMTYLAGMVFTVVNTAFITWAMSIGHVA
ncbi:hypothetical protein [Luteibacter sp. Lutesp34]|uniref:hypothetical protein n=1 Tax=Luteibacter sp. Lutesp34 TaxID=3243030 RepID=UPI0039B4CEFB